MRNEIERQRVGRAGGVTVRSGIERLTGSGAFNMIQ
jgi:hypothetical protein